MQEKETDIYGNKIDWTEGFGYEDEAGLENESYSSTEVIENTTEESSKINLENTNSESEGYKFGFGEVFIIIFIAILFVILFISKRGK
jgi:hypothetical protein